VSFDWIRTVHSQRDVIDGEYCYFQRVHSHAPALALRILVLVHAVDAPGTSELGKEDTGPTDRRDRCRGTKRRDARSNS